MQTTVTFRHMEQSDALRSYAEDKLARVAKYIDEPINAQVFLAVEKIRHIAEVTISAKGVTIKASEDTGDMYAAIDLVSDKIERQLKRYKERLKGHKPSETPGTSVRKSVVEAEGIETSTEPVIVRSTTFSVKPMSVEEAIMQMDLMHKDFFVYTDSTSENINVVYRRKDGNYGLIQSEKG